MGVNDEVKRVCPLRDTFCLEYQCAWYTRWNHKGMCSIERLVQFVNSKDVSEDEKERLRKVMKEKWYG